MIQFKGKNKMENIITKITSFIILSIVIVIAFPFIFIAAIIILLYKCIKLLKREDNGDNRII